LETSRDPPWTGLTFRPVALVPAWSGGGEQARRPCPATPTSWLRLRLGVPWVDSMLLRRSSQTPQEQMGELHAFALLGAIRIAMLWFAQAVEELDIQPGFGLLKILVHGAVQVRVPLLVLYPLILLLLYSQLWRGKRVPPLILDVFGGFAIVSLVFNFLKINLLMLSKVVSPPLLLGQVITFLLFFVIAWGWIFWRLDRLAGGPEQQIVDVPGASGGNGSFDYYYSSLMSLLDGKVSKFNGVSRLGKLLVAIHSLMVLDLAAIALARFYQLVQQAI
jgi:hypothetical protein